MSEDPTYFPNQEEISRTIPPRQNFLTNSEKNFILSSIRENQNNHRCMTPKMIHLFVSELFFERSGQKKNLIESGGISSFIEMKELY